MTNYNFLRGTLAYLEEIRDRYPGPCVVCKSNGLCAVDCTYAPWNMDQPKVSPSMFASLLRQRRWGIYPIPIEAIFWTDPVKQNKWNYRYDRDGDV